MNLVSNWDGAPTHQRNVLFIWPLQNWQSFKVLLGNELNTNMGIWCEGSGLSLSICTYRARFYSVHFGCSFSFKTINIYNPQVEDNESKLHRLSQLVCFTYLVLRSAITSYSRVQILLTKVQQVAMAL